jgi:hypothetical protein
LFLAVVFAFTMYSIAHADPATDTDPKAWARWEDKGGSPKNGEVYTPPPVPEFRTNDDLEIILGDMEPLARGWCQFPPNEKAAGYMSECQVYLDDEDNQYIAYWIGNDMTLIRKYARNGETTDLFLSERAQKALRYNSI